MSEAIFIPHVYENGVVKGSVALPEEFISGKYILNETYVIKSQLLIEPHDGRPKFKTDPDILQRLANLEEGQEATRRTLAEILEALKLKDPTEGQPDKTV